MSVLCRTWQIGLVMPSSHRRHGQDCLVFSVSAVWTEFETGQNRFEIFCCRISKLFLSSLVFCSHRGQERRDKTALSSCLCQWCKLGLIIQSILFELVDSYACLHVRFTWLQYIWKTTRLCTRQHVSSLLQKNTPACCYMLWIFSAQLNHGGLQSLKLTNQVLCVEWVTESYKYMKSCIMGLSSSISDISHEEFKIGLRC